MDIALEDVANVIQNARYQQVLIQNNPKPAAKVRLPKNFSFEEFLSINPLSFEMLISEPLGRYFLEIFADVSVNESSLQNNAHEKKFFHRDVDGFEHKLLKFANDWYFLKKSSVEGKVLLLDVLILVEKYELEDFFDEAMDCGLETKPLTFELAKQHFKEKFHINSAVASTLDIRNALIKSSNSSQNLPQALNGIFVSGKHNVEKNVLTHHEKLSTSAPNIPVSKFNHSGLLGTRHSSLHELGAGSRMKRNGAAVEFHRKQNPQKKTIVNTSSQYEAYNTDPSLSPVLLSKRRKKSKNRAANSHSFSLYGTDEELDEDTFSVGLKEFPSHFSSSLSEALGIFPSRKASGRIDSINRKIDKKLRQLLYGLYEQLVTKDENKPILCEYIKFKYYAEQNVNDKSILYHRVLGQGAFGKVYACVISELGAVMAMKILNKKQVKLKKAREQVTSELEALLVLSEHPNPYTLHLRYAFETRESYHLAIPLAIGGDLKYHLHYSRKEDGERGISLERARIYCAEIAYGLGHLHRLGILMRDLKPRNILLNEDGRVKISDFGLAIRLDQVDINMVQGRAGTEGYWSPQVLEGKYYSFEADWWSYGCCMFELIAGFNPFSTKFTGLKSRNEGTLKGKITFPTGFSNEAKGLVLGLLQRKPGRRLGSFDGEEEIMKQDHPFWTELSLLDIKLGDGPCVWKPDRNIIYAERQTQIIIHEEEHNLKAKMKKVKIGKQDVIPEFRYFCDKFMHQQDLVKIIKLNTCQPRLLKDDWDETEFDVVKTKWSLMKKCFSLF
eukprot:maker-scaffold_20-snap-gene-0.45-mRNA-1 protein AED:0.15 eAED:0.17 QI:0/0/0/1/1/1/2/0/783